MMYRIMICAVLGTSLAQAAPATIDTERLSSIVRELASDEYEGRSPGTPGGRKTVEYLVEQFSALGLEPGGADGRWTHDVPMIHTLFEEPRKLQFVVDGEPQALQQKIDIEASTVRAVDTIAIDAPVVFVGFGAHAPERDWDDYGDIDLEGKVALYLVNDPDFAAEPGEPAAGRFGNRRMTYYGRWAYKFEEAARRGAIAALVIHETEAAGYGWNVASSSPGANYAVVSAAESVPPVLVQGWLHGDVAAALMKDAGYDLDALRIRARSPGFEAFEMEGVSFESDITVTVDHFESSNVLAKLPVLLIMQIAGGADLVEGGREAGNPWIMDYLGNCYHQTCDAWDPDWDLRGAAQDMEQFQAIIEDLGNSRRWPQWKAGSEFKAIRDQSAGVRRAE